MWAFNNIITIEDENNKIHRNMTNAIQAWSIKELLMVLVQI
jgi:transcription termination factor NusB